jgi:hypothetical protein
VCCVDVAVATVQISHLHRPAAAYASEDPAADIPTAGKINPLSRGMQALQPPSQQQQQQSEPMAFCWSSILWTQALQHSNLQVRCTHPAGLNPVDLVLDVLLVGSPACMC